VKSVWERKLNAERRESPDLSGTLSGVDQQLATFRDSLSAPIFKGHAVQDIRTWGR